MGKFEFKNNTTELDIAGHVFHITNTPEQIEKIARQGEAMIQKAEELQDNEGEVETIEALSMLLKDTLDCILGTGAAETIFSGRPFQIYDAFDVLKYIITEMTSFHEEKQAELTVVTPNRAQRRAGRAASSKVNTPEISDPLAELLKNNPAIAEALLKSVK